MSNTMKSGDLPNEKAFEPKEGAHQPMLDKRVPPFIGQTSSKKLTFANSVHSGENHSLQSSSSYKDILSQPAAELSHSQKLLWLQKRRTAGLWAQCDKCEQWRYLPNVIDRHELPQKWYCSLNSDTNFASCSIPEAPLCLHDEEDLIHSEYTAGSLVWARLAGWPWWPAMVDDCPDAEQFYWLDGFSDIPTHYNVVFFDDVEVTRAWIAPADLKPYASNKNNHKHLLRSKKFNSRLNVAMSQADSAQKLDLAKRLEKFSFLSRHKGIIKSPKKVSKHDLHKYQKRFKKMFNIEFPIESSDSDDENYNNDGLVGNRNVIMLGKSKRSRKGKSQTSSLHIAHKQENAESNELRCVQKKDQTQRITESLPSKDVNTDNAPNSVTAQVGSTKIPSLDNDTSTAPLPTTGSEKLDFSIRIDTPNSDDFDF